MINNVKHVKDSILIRAYVNQLFVSAIDDNVIESDVD